MASSDAKIATPITEKKRTRMLSHSPRRIPGKKSTAVGQWKNDRLTASQPGELTTIRATTTANTTVEIIEMTTERALCFLR